MLNEGGFTIFRFNKFLLNARSKGIKAEDGFKIDRFAEPILVTKVLIKIV